MRERRILIRAGIAPEEYLAPERYFLRKPYGTNVGNLVYAYGVFRALMTEDQTRLDADGYRAELGKWTQREIDFVNETYDAYVIPLADAFRKTFLSSLKNLTAVIHKLRIPVIVIGVGIRAPLGYDPAILKPCDETVRRFVSAVLEKSAILGLRGIHTASYLKSLGFREETEFTPIGCPSMYSRGGILPISSDAYPADCASPALAPGLSTASRLILTNNVYASARVHRLMNRIMEQYPNHIYIPQLDREIEAAYFGRPMAEVFQKAAEFPSDYRRPPYQGGWVLLPFQVTPWRECVQGSELCVGPRLHGGIMCTLAGVPTFMLPRDTRSLEVCQYHSFACLDQSGITEEMMLEDLLVQADFQAVSRNHPKNFAHYCDFLHVNGLSHCLMAEDIRQTSALDRKIERMQKISMMLPFCQLTGREKIGRRAAWAINGVKRKAGIRR